MTQPEAMMLVKFIYAQWPHIEVSDEIVTTWRVLLDGVLTLQEARTVAIEALRQADRVHPPTAGELIGIHRENARRERLNQLALEAPRETYEDTKLKTPEERQAFANKLREMYPALFGERDA